MPRQSVRIGLFIAGLLAVGELSARIFMGLGTPPLSMPHPDIEYLFQPNQSVTHSGTRQIYNSHSMRSVELPPLGAADRILVLGDSVLNGSTWTDQADLATSRATAEDPDRFYANISANSWGPGNLRAYLDTFGTFNAAAAILLLNDADIEDVATFAPLHPNAHPVRRPASALWEGLRRYGPQIIPAGLRKALRPVPTPHPYRIDRQPHGNALKEAQRILTLLAEADIAACLLLHPTRAHLGAPLSPGLAQFHALAAAADVPTIDLGAVYAEHRPDPASFYRDNIHLNASGQAVLAKALDACRRTASRPHTRGH